MKTVIIIGASSGIGFELAKQYKDKGWRLGLIARREGNITSLAKLAQEQISYKFLDITEESNQFKKFLDTFDQVDLIINSAGTGFVNVDLDLEKELLTTKVNVDGFTRVTNTVIHFFENQGFGHYVNISSMGSIIGRALCPAYNASKAYQSNYFEAMRQRVYHRKFPIIITDILPGFVDTGTSKLAENQKPIWMASVTKAAKQIIRAIEKKKNQAYVTKRWKILAWFIKLSPLWIRKKLK